MFDSYESLWPLVPVIDTLERKRGREVRKLQTSEYQPHGLLPIIDQGADFICGYTDNLDAAYPYDLPVIVFGDHTRALKYVEFPFVIGADGTQCLHPRAGIDPLYYYYALCNLDLSSEGYARHFKLLKEQKIHLPPLDEQRRIAKVLQSVDRTITEHVAVSSKLKDVQSASFAAFLQSGQADNSAEPVTDWTTGRVEGITKLPRGWSIVRLIDVARLESGHTPSRREPSYWENGDIDWISLHDTKNLERTEITSTELKITQDGLQNSSARLLPRGTVCFSRTATVGKCVIMGHSMATSQDFANFICSKKLNNRYLMYLFRWMQPIWKQLSSGSTHKTIYMPTFESLQIVLPSRTAQDEVVLMMDNLTAMTDQNASVLSVLQRFTTTLTSDLLSGRVRVPG